VRSIRSTLRSFQDSSGDGIGDLVGIDARLEYVCAPGADAWISPIYPSPMAGFDYDVADYCDIDPMFGSLPEFEQLVIHAHHLRLTMGTVGSAVAYPKLHLHCKRRRATAASATPAPHRCRLPCRRRRKTHAAVAC